MSLHAWFKITEPLDGPSEILSSWYRWSVWWWLWCTQSRCLPSETRTSKLRFQRMSRHPGKRQELFCFHPADLQTEAYVPSITICEIIINREMSQPYAKKNNIKCSLRLFIFVCACQAWLVINIAAKKKSQINQNFQNTQKNKTHS